MIFNNANAQKANTEPCLVNWEGEKSAILLSGLQKQCLPVIPDF